MQTLNKLYTKNKEKQGFKDNDQEQIIRIIKDIN